MEILSGKVTSAVKSAAGKPTGIRRRLYQAKITDGFSGRGSRKAEQKTGRGRETAGKGLKELKSGTVCRDNFQGGGRKKPGEKPPSPENDIRDMAEPRAQTDPDSENDPLHMKITAEAVREPLIPEKGHKDGELPADDAIGSIVTKVIVFHSIYSVWKPVPYHPAEFRGKITGEPEPFPHTAMRTACIPPVCGFPSGAAVRSLLRTQFSEKITDHGP